MQPKLTKKSPEVSLAAAEAPPKAARDALGSIVDERGSWRTGGRYAGFHTATLTASLEASGWGVVEARAATPRDAARRSFARHLLAFEHPQHSAIRGMEGEQEARLRIILENSHDRSCAFSLRWGVYRLVCSNGLVVGHDAMRWRAVHRGADAAEQVRSTVERMIVELPQLRVRLGQLASTPLSAARAAAFVRAAYDMRMAYGRPPALEQVRVDYELPLLRDADRGESAWLWLNRAQERVIGGGISYRGLARVQRRGKPPLSVPTQKQTRPVRQVAPLLDLNARLWRLAEEAAGLAEAPVGA